jgi:hypothetical protein
MWIAVDTIGTIVGFENIPTFRNGEWGDGNSIVVFPNFKKKWYSNYYSPSYKEVSNKIIFKDLFKTNEITWKDDPIWVEDCIIEENKYKFNLN